MTRVLTVPGLLGSGPDHWQSLWERLDTRIVRVDLGEWEAPDLQRWRARLTAAVRASSEPTVLVGHSLGAILIAHWAAEALARGGAAELSPVMGALLVAPADVESAEHTPDSVRGFAPVPLLDMPFESIVVASEDDPHLSLQRAQAFASAWGAECINAGPGGHLNAASGLGTWPFGRELLRTLCAATPFALDARLAAESMVVGEGAHSLLLLMNDARYPWFVLVPKRSAVSELFELPHAEQLALTEQSRVLAHALSRTFHADKVNVGMLGNVVRQLHVHHVARRLADPAWPAPVWGHSPREPYAAGAWQAVAARLFEDSDVARCFTPRP